MAEKKRDRRVAVVEYNDAEILTLIGDDAQDTGLIDFVPTKVDIVQADDGSCKITFTRKIQ